MCEDSTLIITYNVKWKTLHMTSGLKLLLKGCNRNFELVNDLFIEFFPFDHTL